MSKAFELYGNIIKITDKIDEVFANGTYAGCDNVTVHLPTYYLKIENMDKLFKFINGEIDEDEDEDAVEKNKEIIKELIKCYGVNKASDLYFEITKVDDICNGVYACPELYFYTSIYNNSFKMLKFIRYFSTAIKLDNQISKLLNLN